MLHTFRDNGSVTLFLPEIDEDGRVTWWQERVATSSLPTIRSKTLNGVGTQIDWAWNEVIAYFNQQ